MIHLQISGIKKGKIISKPAVVYYYFSLREHWNIISVPDLTISRVIRKYGFVFPVQLKLKIYRCHVKFMYGKFMTISLRFTVYDL